MKRSRRPCEICQLHKWRVKVLLNPEMITVRLCRFCYQDLAECGIRMVVLHEG